MGRLTAKQEAFARLVAQGETAAAAYRQVYACRPDITPISVARAASRLRKRPGVQAELDRLTALDRNRKDKDTLATRNEKRGILAEIMRDSKADAGKRVRAIEADNRMTGENAPQQVEVLGMKHLLDLIRDGTKSALR